VRLECAIEPIDAVRMAQTARRWRKTYLREWRKFRERSLESVSARMGLTYTQLSKVERGLHPYNQHILEIAALEYRCTVTDILSRPPSSMDALSPSISRRSGRKG